MDNTLFLRLEAPLQSWGERARWNIRDTAPRPTKSGVIGLLACALGWNEDDRLRELSQNLRFGVRVDREGVELSDYHTVVGGVLAADGKVKKNQKTKQPETVVTNRAYLCDASFLAVVQGDSSLIAKLAAAVQDPVWPIYLGRRSCPPGRPVFEGTGSYPTLEAALADGLHSRAWAEVECEPEHGGLRSDEILSNRHRTFRPRYTRMVLLNPPEVS